MEFNETKLDQIEITDENLTESKPFGVFDALQETVIRCKNAGRDIVEKMAGGELYERATSISCFFDKKISNLIKAAQYDVEMLRGGEGQMFTDEQINEAIVTASKIIDGKITFFDQNSIGCECAHSRILEEFGDNCPSNVNFGRAKTFVESMGLESKPIVFIDENNQDNLEAILAENNIPNIEFNGEAFTSPELNIIFVRRNEEMEKVNGPFFTESIIAHELTHGASGYEGILMQQGMTGMKIGARRNGFCLPNNKKPYGWFFEEGFAEYIRYRYIQRFADEKYRQRVEKAAGAKFNEKIEISDTTESGHSLPVAYFHCGRDGQIRAIVSADAAYAVELLCQAVPGLEAHMVEARTSADGLRKVYRDIESVSPGLYLQLQKGPYEGSSFIEKLKLVEERIAKFKAQERDSDSLPNASPPEVTSAS